MLGIDTTFVVAWRNTTYVYVVEETSRKDTTGVDTVIHP
jgi:hypothetical protein